jgi:hypothetical protein
LVHVHAWPIWYSWRSPSPRSWHLVPRSPIPSKARHIDLFSGYGTRWSSPGANDPAVFKQGSRALPEFCIRADQNKLRPSTCRLEPDKRGDVVNLVNVDLASAPGLLRARFMPCADCPRSSGSGPPRPMPVRQSWGESVLAPGGYGPSSMRRHLLLLAARWALCGSSSRSRSRSSACISAHMHLCTARSTQALVARVAARGSSRRYASVHLRRPRPLPQTGLQSLRRHVVKN